MTDFSAFRVPAIPDRHRGGLVLSWQDYAAWLEQKVAAVQGDTTSMSNIEAEQLQADPYAALPRQRRRQAARARMRVRP